MQTGELIIIILLALVVLGPQRLPELARKAGHWAAELRKAAREITAGLEAEVSEFKDLGNEIRSPLNEIGRDISEAGRTVSEATNKGLEWKGPKPLSGPTPEDAMRDLERIEGRGEDSGATPAESAGVDDEPTAAGESAGVDDEPTAAGEPARSEDEPTAAEGAPVESDEEPAE
jgi:sec-independent protein translocase protein TatB